jgi:aryl-alcohol dehydrogenase-like predicted oxidoreductase
MKPFEKKLLLGTAQWGWNVPAKKAYQLLDAWLESGQKGIDAATNYPINRNPTDFRASERILLEYIHANGLKGELEVTMKIGTLDNMRTPDINLSPSFVLMMGEEYVRLLGKNLHGITLHWDNRSDMEPIGATLSALASLHKNTGIQPGLSGIAHPAMYAAANDHLQLNFDIQAKHNVLHSDLPRYAPLVEQGHRFFVYGINAGGVKLDGQYASDSTFLARGGQPDQTAALLGRLRQLLPEWNGRSGRPKIKNMNQIGLIYALLHPQTAGLLLGVSATDQLKEALEWTEILASTDYSDVFQEIGG